MIIEFPKDAKGREIPLDTGELYKSNGLSMYIYYYAYDPHDKVWFAETTDGSRPVGEFYLTQPDSWEKLEEDLGRAAKRDAITSQCRYFNTTNRCVNCLIHNGAGGCTHKDERAFGDILNRIHKLRGED